MEKAIVATKGLFGWCEYGVDKHGNEFTRSTFYDKKELTASILIDSEDMLKRSSNQVATVWNRPQLSLRLKNNYVRNLCEGCIGYSGTIEGHEWDGQLSSIHSTDSVGLDVFLAYMENEGSKIERR